MQLFTTLTKQREPANCVVAARNCSFIIDEDATLWACGSNDKGQLGLTEGKRYSELTRVELNQRVRQISSSGQHTVLLTEDGQAWVAGYNDSGQLGLNDRQDRNRFTRVDFPERLLRVAAGGLHTALLTESGQVWMAGWNEYGQLGLNDRRDRNVFTRVSLTERVLEVSLADAHSTLLTENGDLWACGNNRDEQLGLSANKVVYADSDDDDDDDEAPDEDANFTRVDYLTESVKRMMTGDQHTTLITESGRLWMTGHNEFGQMGSLVEEDKRVDKFTQVDFPQAVREVASDGYSVLITESGELWLCGISPWGNLGFGEREKVEEFTRLPLPERPVQVSIGTGHTLLLTESGQVWGCGHNMDGQLGLGDRDDRNVFTLIT